jgi:hypothetical protein
MNTKQRKEWEELVENKYKHAGPLHESTLIVLANAYILKLERELQNIKGHKRIAAVLKPKVTE